MNDEPTFQKLLRVVGLGASDQPHEADTAFRKAVEMMRARGVTMTAFLDRLDPSELPQGVCAELARRYYDARDDLSPSDRQKGYQLAFALIAQKYLPNEFRASERKREEPKEPPRRPEAGQGSGPPNPDFVRRMDELRRQQDELRRKQEELRRGQEGLHRTQEEEGRRRRAWERAWETEDQRRQEEAARVWRFPSFLFRVRLPEFRSEFLSDAIRAPVKTVHLFSLCFLSSLIPGIALATAIGGGLYSADIHTFDHIHWAIVLGVSMLPFMVRKGKALYRLGWFYQ